MLIHYIENGRPCNVISTPAMLWNGGTWPSVMVESPAGKKIFNRDFYGFARSILGKNLYRESIVILVNPQKSVIKFEGLFDLELEHEKLESILFEVGFDPSDIDSKGLVKGGGGVDRIPNCGMYLKYKNAFEVPKSCRPGTPRVLTKKLCCCFHVGTGGPAQRLAVHISKEFERWIPLKKITGTSFMRWESCPPSQNSPPF